MSKKQETFTLEVTMKSGAKVEFEVVSATYGIKQLHWTTADEWRSKLLHIDMDEVAAIVARKPAHLGVLAGLG